MNEFMTALLGQNWRTSLAGYVQFLVIGIATYFYEGGTWPISPEGWGAMAYGLFGVWKATNTQDARPPDQHTRATDPPPPVINQIPPKP